jgi:Transposase DDE domain
MAQHNEFEHWDQIERHLRQADGLPFSELLQPERVARALAALGIEYRERVYTPVVTLWTFLWQVLSPDHSCRDVVGRLLAWRLAQGKSPCSTETTSYCEARQRLPVELLKTLVRDIARELQQAADAQWLWKGRPVKIVDGSAVTMPDTPANQAAYPRPRNQQHGVGFPIARVVIVLSLAVGAALDLALGPMRGKKTGETTLFRRLEQALDPGDVCVGDRLFASYHDIARLRQRGVDVVFRQHATRHTDFGRGRWLALDDHVVVWKRPQFDSQRFTRAEWETLPEEMEVRELRYLVTQPGFRPTEVTLVTTLLDPDAAPQAELCELYRQRWNAELDLRSLKTSLQMDRLRCKTPEMVEKEIWAHLLAYNLIRQTMAEAARAHDILPRQVSFRGTVQLVNAFATYMPINRQERDSLWQQLLAAIATHLVADRPNRYEPRKLKYRPGKYTYMTLPRTEERKRLCA